MTNEALKGWACKWLDRKANPPENMTMKMMDFLSCYADDIRREACSEIYEEIRQTGETAIEVGGNPYFINGLYKALQLVDIIMKD